MEQITSTLQHILSCQNSLPWQGETARAVWEAAECCPGFFFHPTKTFGDFLTVSNLHWEGKNLDFLCLSVEKLKYNPRIIPCLVQVLDCGSNPVALTQIRAFYLYFWQPSSALYHNITACGCFWILPENFTGSISVFPELHPELGAIFCFENSVLSLYPLLL